MISSIKIEGYRGFDRFEMEGLARVNLLVGTNNCGKTSVLEALYLLSTKGDPSSLWQLLWRRGERTTLDPRAQRHAEFELDVSHLFVGHQIHLGATKFTLSAVNQTPERHLTFAIGKWTPKDRSDSDPAAPRLALHITGNPSPTNTQIPLSRSGGVTVDSLELSRRPVRRTAPVDSACQFISAESVDSDDLVLLWDKVALTPNEGMVLHALKFLEPNIERIAAQSNPHYFGSRARGGFIVKLRDRDLPIPIGSMGDGMWRMLALAVALTQCRDGVLLIDEIDTGLHYTVMDDMWRLILAAATALNVQVFATTHSYDCIQSLARACVVDGQLVGQATLQRIESGKASSVPYAEHEIMIAAERGIEVR